MHQPAISGLADDDLVIEEVICKIIGGEHTPIHRSTLWRGIHAGRFPRPIKIGPAINRWRVGEGRAVVLKAAAQREAVA